MILSKGASNRASAVNPTFTKKMRQLPNINVLATGNVECCTLITFSSWKLSWLEQTKMQTANFTLAKK